MADDAGLSSFRPVGVGKYAVHRSAARMGCAPCTFEGFSSPDSCPAEGVIGVFLQEKSLAGAL